MNKPYRFIVEVEGGCVVRVWGDRTPEDLEFEFIVRDSDNIFDGDTDPLDGEDFTDGVIYW